MIGQARARRHAGRSGTRVTAAALAQIVGIACLSAQDEVPRDAVDVPLPSCVLRVQIVDPEGKPIPRVAVLHETDSKRTTARALTAPTARGDLAGRVRLTVSGEDLEKRGRLVLLAAPGFASVEMTLEGELRASGAELLEVMDRGTLLMRRGSVLRGLVRSAAGKPVAGAVVVARDILRAPHIARWTDVDHVSRAVTDAKGRFRLPGVPKSGASISVDARGFYRWRAQHANAFGPVIATLDPGGMVRGRVLTRDGKPFVTSIVAFYGMSEETSEVHTDASGRFALRLQHPGVYRLRVSEARLQESSWSATRTAPGNDVVLTVPWRDRPEPALVVRVRGPKGEVVGRARGVVFWQDTAIKRGVPTPLLTFRLRDRGRRGDEGGVIRLPRPAAAESLRGFVRVVAPGFRPQTVQVAGRGGPKDQVLEVRLLPECAIAGRVVDLASGRPLDGVRVAPVDGFRTRTGRIISSRRVRAESDGHFVLGNLEPGKQRLRFSVPGAPDVVKEFTLPATGTLQAGRIAISTGIRLKGWVREQKIGAGWQFQLQKKVEQHLIMLPTSQELEPANPKHRVAVGADGRFELTGLPAGRFTGVLRLPYAMGWIEVPVGDVTLQGRMVTESFFPAGKMPGRLRGKVRATGAPITPGRLLVVATERKRSRMQIVRPVQGPLRGGPCALVGADGSYDLPLAPGRYSLQVRDLATGVTLARTPSMPKMLRIVAEKVRNCSLAVPLAALELEVLPRAEAGIVSWTRLRLRPGFAADSDLPTTQGSWTRTPLRLQIPEHERVVSLVVPVGELRVEARSSLYRLDPGKGPHSMPPRGTVELTLETGAVHRAKLKILR